LWKKLGGGVHRDRRRLRTPHGTCGRDHQRRRGTAASKDGGDDGAGIHVVKSTAEIGEMMAKVLGNG